MRSEGNPLDLNNLPEDYTRDGRQPSEDSSSSAVGGAASGGVVSRKKKSGGAKDGKEDSGKVYECRFCSLKFCKSQALGGHMNRHRQERETETLNKARQLVFTNDLAPGHIGYVSGSGQTITHGGGYHQAAGTNNMAGGGDPSLLPFRSMYPPPPRLFSTSSPSLIPPLPPPQPQAAAPPPYMYASPPQLLSFHSSQYPAPPPNNNDYFVGHVLSSNEGNYTCIGAPVGHGFTNGVGSGGNGDGVRDVTLQMNQEEGLSWGRR